MAAWLDVDGFALRSVMPAEDVERLEEQYPGYLTQQIAVWQRWIESRLWKRYALPFGEPAPETAIGWLVSLVTLAAYQRRGWNPAGAENQLIIDAATTAREEVKEAADSVDGLFELPLRDTATAPGVSLGGPFGYSETSPYVWTDRQRETGRSEDDG